MFDRIQALALCFCSGSRRLVHMKVSQPINESIQETNKSRIRLIGTKQKHRFVRPGVAKRNRKTQTYPKAPAIRKTTHIRPTSIVKVKATMPAMDKKYIPTVVPLQIETEMMH